MRKSQLLKASAIVVALAALVLFMVQVVVTGTRKAALVHQQELVEQERINQIEVARREAVASAFIANRKAILGAIRGQIAAGELDDAYAEVSKYDNKDTELDELRHQIKVALALGALKHESELPAKTRAVIYENLAALEPSNKEYSAKAQAVRVQVAAQENASVEREGSKSRLLEQFSQWDGSHRNVEAAIKARMNDPDSYKHVETKYKETSTGAVIYTKFRGKNGFGAVITNAAVATVDFDGTVLSLEF
jgi:hypothetical protein